MKDTEYSLFICALWHDVTRKTVSVIIFNGTPGKNRKHNFVGVEMKYIQIKRLAVSLKESIIDQGIKHKLSHHPEYPFSHVKCVSV